MADTVALSAPLQGRFFLRMQLREEMKNRTAGECTSIRKMLASDKMDSLTQSCMDEAGITQDANGALPTNWLAVFIAWITNPTNLALIISIILALFPLIA